VLLLHDLGLARAARAAQGTYFDFVALDFACAAETVARSVACDIPLGVEFDGDGMIGQRSLPREGRHLPSTAGKCGGGFVSFHGEGGSAGEQEGKEEVHSKVFRRRCPVVSKKEN